MKKFLLFLCIFTIPIFALEPQEIIKNNCSTCHGSLMERECFGVSKIPNTLDSETIYNALIAYKKGELNQYKLGGAMTARVNNLSEEEIKALSLYICTLKDKK